MILLAFGIWRIWRTAAVCALVLSVAGKIVVFTENIEITGPSLVGSLLVLVMHVNGVPGTFAHRALRRRELANSAETVSAPR